MEDPWSRAMPPGARAGAGFLKVTNTGTESDRLVGGSTTAAGRVEIHEMAVTDNIMKMRLVDGGLEIPPGGSVELKPGSYHVMFLDVPSSFVEGSTLAVTLKFAKAGEVAIDIPVKSIGEGARMHMNMGHGMGMGGMMGMGMAGMGMGMGGMGGMSGMQGQK
ncbi:MAG: copper chaperone PCu(A)C [Hyphomicrobiales bacterium]